MVTRGTYYEDDEQFQRRYSARGHSYPPSQERDLSSAPHHDPYARNHHISSRDAPRNGQSPEQDSNAQPRRRIPVACGRCRKRKIRCSGDPGNGQPCSNCKSAGNEACQFLRVSSQEAPMKGDSTEYGYDAAPAQSRFLYRMNPYGPQHGSQPYATQVSPLIADGFTYRHNSLSGYPLPAKYFGIPPFNDYADESVEYGIQASSYPLMNSEHISIPYAGSESARGWTPAPPILKNTSLFVEQEPSYGHGLPPCPSNTYPLRPTISPESKSLSINGIPTSLPAPMINGPDRVLPYPAANRPAPVASFMRSTESFLPMSQSPMNFHNGLMSASMVSGLKSQVLNATLVSENTSLSSAYLPRSSGSPESAPSSNMSYGTQSVSSSSQNHDSYASSHDSSLFHHNNNSGELVSSYGPSSTSSDRPSVSSQANGEGSQQSSLNDNGGHLANGQFYYPPVTQQSSYPAPPMVDMPPPTPPAPRHSVSI